VAVTFLAGNRAVGTSAERLSTFTANPAGWVELGRTTLGSSNANIDVTGLSSKRYYMLLLSGLGHSGAPTDGYYQLGDSSFDTGSNYSSRYSYNGDEGYTGNLTKMYFDGGSNIKNNTFTVGYLTGHSSKEKLYYGHHVTQETAGAGNAPFRGEQASKWANTSSPITRIRALTDSSSQTWNSGSELVVLGYDPADTHTNNFWTELLAESPSSNTSIWTPSSWASKKYLWIQVYAKPASGAAANIETQFNGDTSSNYSWRRSTNGAADSSGTSQTHIKFSPNNSSNNRHFLNMFVVNVANKEKLVIGHAVTATTTGAGTAPERAESTGKWVNTSTAITSIRLSSDSGNGYSTDSYIRVWGSD